MLRPARALPALLLLAWAVGTTALSWRFASAATPLDEPIVLFVALQVGAGIAWWVALRVLRRGGDGRGAVMLVVAVGILLRLPFFFSTPILEDDHYRYLWDGAVTAHGLDPYAHAPRELLEGGGPEAQPWPDLVAEGQGVLARVNHPELKTIYPPVAQGAFALAYRLAPWDVTGLRFVWLFLDLSVLGLLALALRAPRAWRLAVYAWNPLLLKEVYGSLHMEPVLLAFAAAALLLAARRRIVLASAALAFAIGAKLWPALWLPLLLRMRGVRPKQVLVGALVAGVLAAFLLLPLVGRVGDPASGLGAFAGRWEMNDSAFVLIQGFFALAAPEHASTLARGFVALLLLALLFHLLRRPVVDAVDLGGRALALVAALFLLSPTQFPWYSLWLLPPLALAPRRSLLLLTVTLPLYSLRFRFADWGMPALFDYGVVWLQFVPVWILLLLEMRRTRRATASDGSATWRPACALRSSSLR